MKRRVMQTESRGHKTLETFFKKRNAWSATGKEGTHRETGEKTKEYQEVDHEGNPTGKRHWRNDKGQNMGESHAPVAPVPDKKYIKGTPEHKALKAASKPINGHPTNKVKEEVEHIEESDAAWAASKEKEKEQRLTSKDQKTLGSIRAMLDKEKKPVKESYDEAEEHLSKANDAEREGRMKDFHAHMADHHDALSMWHDSKGRSASADKHAEKADYHHQKSLTVKEEVDLRAQLQKHSDAAIAANKAGDDEKVKYHMSKMNAVKDKMAKQARNEEVAANNVGGGSIAGTQGDAGKKVVMTKEPLKRKALQKFKSYVSQEHDGY
jgi:hypothetical protein